jgi:hypothetical protein
MKKRIFGGEAEGATAETTFWETASAAHAKFKRRRQRVTTPGARKAAMAGATPATSRRLKFSLTRAFVFHTSAADEGDLSRFGGVD